MAEMIMCNTHKNSKPTTIDELSDEILLQILHRFPLSFLLQCKSINKRFLRVISDPRFFHPRLTNHHRQPRFQNHTLLFPLLFHFHSGSNHNKKTLFSIDSNNKTHILNDTLFLPRFCLNQDRNRFRVKATHLDLVLCSTHNRSHTHYFVCNPFTKQHVVLPPIPKSHSQELARVGFIYDQCRSRFRVVHIPFVCFEFVTRFQAHVFSSETGEWGVSDVEVPHAILMSFCYYPTNVIVHNGSLRWWMREHGFLVCDDPFDGWGSTWRLVRSPCAIFDGSKRWEIYNGVCNGRVMTCVYSMTDLDFKVYLFDQDFHATAYRFDLQVVFGDESLKGVVSVNDDVKLLAFHPLCECMIYFYANESVFLCDCKRQKVECVYTVADDNIHIWSGNVMSLVLPEWPTLVPTLNAPKP